MDYPQRTTGSPSRWSSSAARAHAGVASVMTQAEVLIAARRLAGARPYLAAVAGTAHHYPAAAATLAGALELFRDLGHQRGEARTLHQLGVVHRATGDYPAATATLTRALHLSSDVADWHGQAWALHDLGELLFLSSAYRRAGGHFTQALSIARDLGIPVEQARALRESDDAAPRKETQANAPQTHDNHPRSPGASAPPRLSGRNDPPQLAMTTEGGGASPQR